MTAAKIRQTLKRVRDPTIRERLLMIQDAYEMPLRDVAKRHGCTHGKIDFWKKRYEAGGLRGLSTRERPGRPPKISEDQALKLRRRVRKHDISQGWRTKHVRTLIKEETGVTYTRQHTVRLLHTWGLSQITPRPRSAYSKKEDREMFIKKTRGIWHANPSTKHLS